MFPIITVLGKPLGCYALLAAAGTLAAGVYACRRAARNGWDDNDMLCLLCAAALGAFLGGHLLYGVVNTSFLGLFRGLPQAEDKLRFTGDILLHTFGGQVFFGGLLGGIATGALYARKKRLPLGLYCDILAAAVPLFHGFGRIGCFLGGCCYGVESPVGFVFTHALLEEANHIRRFPVQLAEAAFCFCLFALFHALRGQRALQKRLFPLYLLLYSIGRLFLEFLRGDAARGLVLGISTSQIIALLLCATAAVLLIRNQTPKGT